MISRLVFILIIVLPVSAYAAFDENSLRHLSPWDVVLKLETVFPVKKKHVCSDLQTVGDDFGVSSPVTGSPIANTPTPLTVRWLEVCMNQISETAFDANKSLWAKEKPEQQQKILLQMMHQILGDDEVILSYGLISNVDDFVEQAKKHFAEDKKLSVWEVRKRWTTSLVLRDEFLSY